MVFFRVGLDILEYRVVFWVNGFYSQSKIQKNDKLKIPVDIDKYILDIRRCIAMWSICHSLPVENEICQKKTHSHLISL